ncbi:Uncharacterized protein OBRU01_05240 [Operophtera brumata]|uniref:PKS/mFAS DH domain-containing protein n=1 Tax=Operophtera brumata TaxID=104452 RepID=A0A0L7LMW6_OPEBR|nr:Uncharacterized protein OBRU01_05240 [Operophtera brumata]
MCSYSPSSEPLLPVREPTELQEFLESFYSEIDVSSGDVEYVEANGAALVDADSNELKAIGRVFGKKQPIKVGCVKSNMGSSEPASGVCGLTKVLTDTVKFNGGFAALNSFSFGGANVHVLLKGHFKEKDDARYKSSIPYLVLISGRHNDSMESLMETFTKKPVDPEQIGLLHSIHQYDITGHMSRAYSILDTNADNETVCLSQSIEYCPGTTRPLWFVYSGMGSQWATMGADLMRIPTFAAAIQKCHKVLDPRGIDIIRILTNPDKTIYDNILHSFVGIAAVQIGLTDILTEMGIVPDYIIGHSVGELGCAYADGCFTAEEMILSAYSRGLVSVQTNFIRGSMAAVGLGYKAILPLCPPGIEVACHNSSESATISGPSDIMTEFVAKLTAQGIFAKEVPCSNIAYHSRYIAEAGPGLLKYLSDVIKTPKLRSKKWVSTSNAVLFEETSKLIPTNALVIEIAPHGLLQAILKRSLSECLHVPLTRRRTSDPVTFLLEAVGKLYQAGLNPKVDILYPKIEYPVSTGTPFLSQYVRWEHSEDWAQAKHYNKDRRTTKIRDFVMSIHDDDYSYLKGHVRHGNCVFPEAAFLQLIWENLAMYQGVNYRDMSVVFRDVHFHREVIIKSDVPLRLRITINKGSNRFEVIFENTLRYNKIE